MMVLRLDVSESGEKKREKKQVKQKSKVTMLEVHQVPVFYS